jgi:bacteriocin biosynthesis cyclodehydratase domain-containing protein
MTAYTTLVVVGVGEFGVEVARMVAASTRAPIVELSGDEPQIVQRLPEADVVVLARGRSHRVLEDELDRRLARNHRWISAVYDHPHVRIGPFATAERACYGCLRGRLRQHAAQPEVQAEIDAYLGQAPGTGPVGFSPAHVSIAAGAIQLRLGVSTVDPGTVWRFNVVSHSIAQTTLIPMHHCRLCSPLRDHHLQSRGLASQLGVPVTW